eukprot:3155465-Amphidinium_carterae.1
MLLRAEVKLSLTVLQAIEAKGEDLLCVKLRGSHHARWGPQWVGELGGLCFRGGMVNDGWRGRCNWRVDRRAR